jgi:hypothetical protein
VIRERNKIEEKIRLLENKLQDRFPNQPADLNETVGTQFEKGAYYQQRFEQWIEEAENRAMTWEILQPESMHSKFHATMTRLPDHSVLASGDKPNRDIYTLEFTTELTHINGFRLEALPHPSLPQGGPGRAHFFQTGDFLLSEFKVESLKPNGEWIKHSFQSASDSHHKDGHEAQKSIDGKLDTGWQIGNRTGEAHQAVFTLDNSINSPSAPLKLRIVLDQSFIHQVTLGRFRLSATSQANPKASGLPAEVEALFSNEEKHMDK